jgi:hypothetical protein
MPERCVANYHRMSLMKMFLHKAGSIQYNDALSTEKLRTCVHDFEVCVNAHTLFNVGVQAVLYVTYAVNS